MLTVLKRVTKRLNWLHCGRDGERLHVVGMESGSTVVGMESGSTVVGMESGSTVVGMESGSTG